MLPNVIAPVIVEGSIDGAALRIDPKFAKARGALVELKGDDSTLQDRDIQVSTPSLGRTQRINTRYAAKNSINTSQPGIRFSFFTR